MDQIGALAEAEGHHPDISFGWGYYMLKTHKNQWPARERFHRDGTRENIRGTFRYPVALSNSAGLGRPVRS